MRLPPLRPLPRAHPRPSRVPVASPTSRTHARHPPRPPLARAARRIPGWLLRQMLLNNAVSAAVGLVPFVGDVVLAMYKANSRNAALLEEFLRIRGEEFLKMQAGRAASDDAQQAALRPGAGREVNERIPVPTKQDAIPERKVPEPERAALTPAGTSTGPKSAGFHL